MNLRDIPSMAILFVIYNVLALVGMAGSLDTSPLFHLPMVSGAQVPVTGGAILTIIGLIFLYIEIFKSTRADAEQMLEQTFSMGLFVVFLVEFLLIKGAGTTTFFMLMIIQLLDVMAGFTVTVASKRAGLQVGR
ncbi:MAG: hypothetical protein RIT27_1914 [Pseudomonadota bacterium]|jgi:hypothetical protein